MLPARTFLASASKLTSATVLAQAFNFALSFVLARLYTSGEFGHYSIFIGVSGVLGAASTGGFDRVILLARSSNASRRAAILALLLSIVGALAVSLVGFGLAVFRPLPGLPITAIDLMLFMPVFMVSYAGAQVLNYSCLRQNRVPTIAGFKIAQSVTTGIVQVTMSSIKMAPGLILGSIAGWAIYLIGAVDDQARQWPRRLLTSRGLLCVARRYAHYPRYVMPNEVMDNLSNQLPLLLIGSLVSLSSAGHYGLALMMLSAPAALMGQAVGQAFLQYIGNHDDNYADLEQMMRRIWIGMALFGIVPFTVILAFGPEIFRFGFGYQWIGAGEISQTLAILLFIRFVSSPTSTIYWKLHMQREQWYFSVAATVYRPTCYGLAVFDTNLSLIIGLHVAVEVVAIVIYNIVAIRRLRLLATRQAEETAA